MKYLKLFEVTESLYWEINVRQPYFEIALKKIGMPPEIIKTHLHIWEDAEDEWIYLFREYDEEDDQYMWDWSSSNYTVPITRGSSKFMGKIVIEDWEVDAKRYNV